MPALWVCAAFGWQSGRFPALRLPNLPHPGKAVSPTFPACNFSDAFSYYIQA
ncbi:MAG TPA: hypothetical protein PK299_05400 [Anaerolineales bacterium]|nr:hypothetical protein [Anaerolineales bacterium]